MEGVKNSVEVSRMNEKGGKLIGLCKEMKIIFGKYIF